MLSKTKILFLILYILPVALLLWFIATFSINVPFWDQWRLVNLFEGVGSGNANFSDFFEVHGHHRIFFPKIIITALAFASGWNTQYEMLCSVIFVVITFGAICYIAASQAPNRSDKFMHVANLLTCIFLFSLVQHQNWLWGFTLFWFLTNLSAVMAVVFLCEKLPPTKTLIFAGISCFIGSFTLAQGLLAFPILIPAVFSLEGSRSERGKRVLIWMGIFLLLCFIYSIDYNPIREPKPFLFLEQPLLVINYFFTVLSLPLIRIPIPSIITGFILLSSFLFFSFYFLKKHKYRLALKPEALPWFSIGLFAIISSLSITAGRAQYGVENAIISSRYTTTSVLLIVALIHLLALFLRERQKGKSSQTNYLSIFNLLAVALAGIMAFNSIYVINRIKSEFTYMQGRKECLEIINYLEESDFIKESPESCLVLLNGKTWLVREGAAIMENLGWREFPEDIDFIREPPEVYGYLDNPFGSQEILTISNGEVVTLTGWASFPGSKETPNLVLFSVGENRTFFANAFVVLDSPDLAEALNSNKYRKARWQVSFSGESLKSLSGGEGAIAAWAYNAEEGKFVKLNEEIKIEVKIP